MRIVFLDFDGVICTPRAHVAYGDSGLMRRLDPVGIQYLNRLVDIDPDLRFVISSTWRKHFDQMQLEFLLGNAGFIGTLHEDWKTVTLWRGHRGTEVNEWLARHPETTQWIAIDDDSDFLPGQPLVKTHYEDGISSANFREMCEKLFGSDHAWIDFRQQKATSLRREDVSA